MKDWNEISENEICVLGYVPAAKKKPRFRWALFYSAMAAALACLACGLLYLRQLPEQALFEPDPATAQEPNSGNIFDRIDTAGYSIAKDTTINDVGLRLIMPIGATATLHIGRAPTADDSIICIAQAADVRADNHKILGGFVLDGELIARGVSKKGYCAIIDNKITVGVSDNTPLFEEATGKNGYFFRQYPLVDNGALCENEPKNKSFRRALCQRNGETFIVNSYDKESFHDFAQALVDLGVDNAIYLVGGSSFGWAVLEDGSREEWGDPGIEPKSQNVNYLVFRRD